jgi:spectinomycin phosphotransferase
MLTEPGDLPRSELESVLERHWGLIGVKLSYLPVGFGGHHWLAVDSRGARRFVTADDLQAGFQHGADTDEAFAALERAYRTAAALHDRAGLDFVVAPQPDDAGGVLRRLSDRHAVTVAPYVDGHRAGDGSYASHEDRRAMGRILGLLHAATEHVPTELPRAEDFAVPSRAALDEALRDLDLPWDSGPFAESTRGLLRKNAPYVERRLREYDELAAEVRERSRPWVVTHGEPHSANVLRHARSALLLVDWDTTLLAPRERDLRMVLDRDQTGWAEYIEVVGSVALNERALELYRLWWDLAEIAIYVHRFRRPHDRTEDVVASWRYLQDYLPIREG